jgi:hypothetical protein
VVGEEKRNGYESTLTEAILVFPFDGGGHGGRRSRVLSLRIIISSQPLSFTVLKGALLIIGDGLPQ